jgi:hypothetical protein
MLSSKHSLKICNKTILSNSLSSNFMYDLIFFFEDSIISNLSLFFLKKQLKESGVSYFSKIGLQNPFNISKYFYYIMVIEKLSLSSNFYNLFDIIKESMVNSYAYVHGKKFRINNSLSVNLRSTLLYVKVFNYLVVVDTFFYIFDFVRKYNTIVFLFVVFFFRICTSFIKVYGNIKSNS